MREQVKSLTQSRFEPSKPSADSEAALERLPTIQGLENFGASSPRFSSISPLAPSPGFCPRTGFVAPQPPGCRRGRGPRAIYARDVRSLQAGAVLTVLPERRGAGGRPQGQRQRLGDRPAEIHRARCPQRRRLCCPLALRGAGSRGELRPGEERGPLPSPARVPPGGGDGLFARFFLPQPSLPTLLLSPGSEKRAVRAFSEKGSEAEKSPSPAELRRTGWRWFRDLQRE